jgi:transcriptional regulator with XRE-family HTH domain
MAHPSAGQFEVDRASAEGNRLHEDRRSDPRDPLAERTIVTPHTLGEALRLLKGRSGLSRDELAAKVGLSSGALSSYLSDVRTPSAPVLRSLATVLAEHLRVDPMHLWAEFGVLLGSVPVRRPDRTDGRVDQEREEGQVPVMVG